MIKDNNVAKQTGFKEYLKNTVGMLEEEVEKLSAKLTHMKFEKGSILLKKGDVCKHSFFVEKGLLRSYTLDENGKEHVIQFAP